MTTATLLPNGEQTFLDNNGVPLAGGKVYMYVPSTTVFKNTWKDAGETTLNTNPIILDSSGRAIIYGSGQYRQVVYDSLGNLIWDQLTTDLLYLFNLPATTRTRLSADTNFYVSTTGSNSNNGSTPSLAWLTIQFAANYIQDNIDLGGFNATINVADGTYNSGVIINGPFFGSGSVQILGDTTTPSNCVISTTNSAGVQANSGAVFSISGFKITGSGGHGIYCTFDSIIIINGKMEYGAITGGFSQIVSAQGAAVIITSDYTVSGSAAEHILAGQLGYIFCSNRSLVISGTPAFSGAFIYAYENSLIDCTSMTFSGSATGIRFNVFQNSVLATGTNTLTYFPGNVAGIFSSGGLYNTLSNTLQASNNLSDLANLATSLGNLSFAFSDGASGYIKIPNATDPTKPWIFQWGQFTTSASGLSTWTFPVTFPNNLRGIQGIPTNTGATTRSQVLWDQATSTTSGAAVGSVSGTGTSLATLETFLAYGN